MADIHQSLQETGIHLHLDSNLAHCLLQSEKDSAADIDHRRHKFHRRLSSVNQQLDPLLRNAKTKPTLNRESIHRKNIQLRQKKRAMRMAYRAEMDKIAKMAPEERPAYLAQNPVITKEQTWISLTDKYRIDALKREVNATRVVQDGQDAARARLKADKDKGKGK